MLFRSRSNLEFDGGTSGWQTFLDGVMGGRSTGRITAGDGGTLRFTGELSLENNGGFSQIRTAVPEGTFAGTSGLVLRVKGDGRSYQCDIRSSRLRLMAGGYQSVFKTKAGEWAEVEIPFDQCVAKSFGQRLRNAPALDPASIESVGITLADKQEGPFAIEVDWIRPIGATASERSPAASLSTVATKANLTTLLALVKAAEIEFPKDAKLTVFAPTNEAFAALPAGLVDKLLLPENKDVLVKILTYHVVSGAIMAADVTAGDVASVEGGNIAVTTNDGGVQVNGANVVTADIVASNGVIHVIDAVILPPDVDPSAL